uniref:Double-GTPase 1 domain-containing protein n=1 Tax=Candidatus Kentrum sp. FW TaxID=2126338 RepID=A0A450TWV6_9GAMM|nr:MAG: hypothetical protein BECKFW1821C_GA0114237_10533 [Candidatus Kentron sp. FW]
MAEHAVVIMGLPESGKTTFLAALWHLVTARDSDIKTALRFDNLRSGGVAHLNGISARWREARVQDRTSVSDHRIVSMNLLDANGTSMKVTFPDLSGEVYRRMWEERDCEPEVVKTLNAEGVLLFIHADTIQRPRWVVDEAAFSKALDMAARKEKAPEVAAQEKKDVPWHPGRAPTQVQLVDLLQLLCLPPLDVDIGPRRLAIMLSAWDKVGEEGLGPDDYLKEKLPLLGQYLRSGADGWIWRVYGLSAQGGDYDDPEKPDVEPNPEAEKLRDLDRPSERIELFQDSSTPSHDLTEPLAWLMK